MTAPAPNLVEVIRLRRRLHSAVLGVGLRQAGRLLGDVHRSNTWAMRLHRMLASPAALGRAEFLQVLQAARALDVPLP